MMAEWMLYCTLCAIGLSLAALLAERVLLAGRGAVRHVWFAAVACSLIVPVLAFQFAPRKANLPADAAPVTLNDRALVLDTAGMQAEPVVPATHEHPIASPSLGDRLARADRLLAIAWAVMSFAFGVHLVLGIVVLRRMRRAWRSQIVLGVPVLVSERTGPALVGAVAPAIVLPEWALALDPAQLALMLRHEQEHQRAHDGRLLFVAQCALVAMPWNVALWWQVMRLRVAIEMDCDARVLRDADAASYGDLLLEVVRPRPMLAPAGATSFAEHATQLERRIRVMYRSRHATLRGARPLALAVVLGAVSIAWMAPRPLAPARNAPAAAPVVSHVDSAVRPNVDSSVTPAPPRTAPVAPAAERASVRPDRFDSTDAAGGILARLFADIPLTRAQETQAHEIVTGVLQRQAAQQDSLLAALAELNQRLSALQRERDTTLLSLASNAADRSLLSSRLSPNGGGTGRGQRGGGPGGQRGGGPGRGTTDEFARLFAGIPLSPDQETRARTAIVKMQTEQQALARPPRVTQLVALGPLETTVLIEAKSDAALMGVIKNAPDRRILRARMVNPPPSNPPR